MRTPEIILTAFLIPLGLGGCGLPPPRSPIPTGEDALSRMRDSYLCVNGVQGRAKIDRFSPEQGRIRGEVYIFAVNPDRVRFDVVSPFGATLYTLTSDGERFEMADLGQKQFLYGPSTPCNLARLTQVPVPGHALVSLLRGEAPVLVHAKADAVLSWNRKGFYQVAIRSTRNASEEIHLEVHPDDWDKPWQKQRLRVTDVRVSQGGVDLYHAELGRHEPARTAKTRIDEDGLSDPIPPSGGACGAELPRSIRMEVPHTREVVVFQYKEAQWNPPIVDGAFSQPVPGGMRRVFVNCTRP